MKGRYLHSRWDRWFEEESSKRASLAREAWFWRRALMERARGS
jgi:hypothetical protein